MIEHIRAVQQEAELAGIDVMALSTLADGLRGLVRTIEEADDRTLCAAVRACTRASGTLERLWERAEERPDIPQRLMADVMWDQWALAGGFAPCGTTGEIAIAMSTVQFLATPGWADDLHRYQALMDGLLATVPSGPVETAS